MIISGGPGEASPATGRTAAAILAGSSEAAGEIRTPSRSRSERGAGAAARDGRGTRLASGAHEVVLLPNPVGSRAPGSKELRRAWRWLGGRRSGVKLGTGRRIRRRHRSAEMSSRISKEGYAQRAEGAWSDAAARATAGVVASGHRQPRREALHGGGSGQRERASEAW